MIESGIFSRWFGILRSLAIYWRPGRQRRLRRMYREFVEPGDLVFDVGAHLGDRTAAFSALGARVVALEPNPHLLPWLRRMVGGKDGVSILEEAVGATPGSARLKRSRRTPTVSTLAHDWSARMPRANPSFRSVRWEDDVPVRVTTLDRLIQAHGLPAFCKIDVEGHEAAVLDGLSVPLPALSVEWVQGALDRARSCVERLEALGRYEFNVVPGEGRDLTFRRWMDPDEIDGWLADGAGGAASGDLYARRVVDGTSRHVIEGATVRP